jgi:hypothetical protein
MAVQISSNDGALARASFQLRNVLRHAVNARMSGSFNFFAGGRSDGEDADAVFVNTAIAIASDPVRMAKAFKKQLKLDGKPAKSAWRKNWVQPPRPVR